MALVNWVMGCLLKTECSSGEDFHSYNLWLHLKYPGLNKAEFNLVTDNFDTGWVCRTCTWNTLPFHNHTNPKSLKEILT